MLNRRHIRIKVMQSVYALFKSKSDDFSKEEKYLKHSISKIYDLYVLFLNLLVEVRIMAEKHQEIAKKKYLATNDDINPSRKFIDHKFLLDLQNNQSLKNYSTTHKLTNWKKDSEYVRVIWDEIQESDIYLKYLHTNNQSSKDDIQFIEAIFKAIIAPNEKLFDYFESQNLSWVDDIPFVNTLLLKNINTIKLTTVFSKNKLYKNNDDEAFVTELFKSTLEYHDGFTADIDRMTPNWDTDRIAEIDLILIKMALVEFSHFSSIPTRVTINEYIEIAKDYSTSKSSFFINGVLDKLLKDYTASGRIKKIGRGLL